MLVTLALVGGALLIDGILAARSIKNSLGSMRSSLSDAQSAIEDGDLNRSRMALQYAEDAGRRTAAHLGRPSLAVAARLPFVKNDVLALRALTDAGSLFVDSGKSLIAVSRSFGINPGQAFAAAYENGTVDLDVVSRASAGLSAADKALMGAKLELGRAPEPVLDELERALTAARAAVDDARGFVHPATVLTRVFPSILGESEERRYLIGFQALGEARGTGGVIGTAAMITARDGHLELENVVTPRELLEQSNGRWGPRVQVGGYGPRRPVSAPDWFVRGYSPQKALTQWQQVNTSPSYDVVGAAAAEMYTLATNKDVDGILFLDPVALADLLTSMDPIPVPELDTRLGADNAVDVLLRDAYTELNETEQDIVLKRAVAAVWAAFERGDLQPAAFLRAVGKTVDSRHFVVWLRSPDEQAAMEEVGAAGLFPDDPNVQMVFHNNYGLNKVDYFLRRKVDTEIRLTDDGNAQVLTRIDLQNTAPAGLRNDLVGTLGTAGRNRMLLSAILPKGSELAEMEAGSGNKTPLTWTEFDRPAVGTVVTIPPGGTRTVFVRYRILRAMTHVDQGWIFRFVVVPQATVEPDRYTLSVTAPPRSLITGASDNEARHSTWRTSGVLIEPRAIELRVQLETN